jgi:hypothetical protein
MKDDSLYLFHISECPAQIEKYVAGGQEAFARSDEAMRQENPPSV